MPDDHALTGDNQRCKLIANYVKDKLKTMKFKLLMQ